MPDVSSLDACSPRKIAARVNAFGVGKAQLPLVPLALLGLLAGAFIGLGSMMFTLVARDATLGFAASRLLGGLVFLLGLILVTVAGAELFTGNNLLAMAWASGRVSTRDVLLKWAVVCAANWNGTRGRVRVTIGLMPGTGRSGATIDDPQSIHCCP